MDAAFLNHLLTTLVSLLVLVLWIIALLGVGNVVLQVLRVAKSEPAYVSVKAWLGLAVTVSLVESLHLFFPVRWSMSMAIGALGLIGFVADRHARNVIASAVIGLVTRRRMVAAIGTVVLFLWISRSLSNPDDYDAGLYHYGAIKWINHDSIVPGLGNLHGRFAFNQSYFGFLALLNVAPFWMLGYTTGGLLLMTLVAMTIIEIHIWRRDAGMWIPASLLVATASQARYLGSPTPDLAIALLQLVCFALVFKILSHGKEQRSGMQGDELALLALCVLMPTVKLGAALFAAGCISILFMACAVRWFRHPVQLLIVGIVCALAMTVHLGRGLLLSGAPLYPSTLAGNWSLEWSVPIEMVRAEASWVYSWARSPGLTPDQVLGNWDWISLWMYRLPIRGWILFAISMFMALADGFLAWRGWTSRCARHHYLLYIPLVISVVFWFFTAPDLRFLGLVPELLAVLSGWLLVQRWNAAEPAAKVSKWRFRQVMLLWVVIALFSCVSEESFSGIRSVPVVETGIKWTDAGLKVVVPLEGDQCWLSPLPCTPYFQSKLTSRPVEILPGYFRDGFVHLRSPGGGLQVNN